MKCSNDRTPRLWRERDHSWRRTGELGGNEAALCDVRESFAWSLSTDFWGCQSAALYGRDPSWEAAELSRSFSSIRIEIDGFFLDRWIPRIDELSAIYFGILKRVILLRHFPEIWPWPCYRNRDIVGTCVGVFCDSAVAQRHIYRQWNLVNPCLGHPLIG